MSRFYTFLICCFLVSPFVEAQVVTTEPVFPQLDDDVTIYFDASKGNGALRDFTGDVYAHTGVITDESTGPTDWQNVIGEWGTADSRTLMTRVGPNRYQLTYNIKDYYDIEDGTEVMEMAFVFRNQTGSIVGRSTDGSDIYTPVYSSSGSLFTTIVSPEDDNLVLAIGSRLSIKAASSLNADLTLTDNGVELVRETGNSLNYVLEVKDQGNHIVEFTAKTGGEESKQQFQYVVPSNAPPEDLPAGVEYGINYISDTEVVLALYAPNKRHVFVLGDFNNWALDVDFQMKKTTDGNAYWFRLENLTPGQQYGFQYFVDGSIRAADPYSTLILDPFNDGFVPEETFPDLPEYPVGASGIISILQTDAPEYDWEIDDFVPAANSELVIYELLMRDFVARHDYQTLLDTLDYLERLGINAIELMPVNEFEGNDSWGYNPSFHMALDKYYGTAEDFKRFIDEAHARGMAVIIDVVYNHAFSQSPLAQLYWDPLGFKPTPENPWLNPDAKHPFNVGYDFNHESEATKFFVKKTLRYWLDEFRIDGFRFDLSKGFSQVDYGDDSGAFAQYDSSRVAILQDYADVVWAENPNAINILEHFAVDEEEVVLADYGMLLWNNSNFMYGQAGMGYENDLSRSDYAEHGFTKPHLVTYMESHDEERLLYRITNFGNESADGSYKTKTPITALRRAELASTFFYTIPGPKMLWQFGEMGYDFSINRCTDGSEDPDCRLSPKPIRWDYLTTSGRRHLFDVTRSLIGLKTTYDVFNTTDYDLWIDDSNKKRIQLNSDDLKVNVLGNFNVEPESIDPAFQQTGRWYEYFTGDSLDVSDVNAMIALAPGEYRLYTTDRLDLPTDFLTSANEVAAARIGLAHYPNPVAEQMAVVYELESSARVRLEVYNLLGQQVSTVFEGQLPAGPQLHTWTADLPEGTYFLRLAVGNAVITSKFMAVD
ncbi:MAG: alpha-amylase family glycosyl hydrolase [Bacteroidota bacterium]